MNPVYVEGVSMSTNDDVVLKLKTCDSDTYVDIDIDRDEGLYISELLLDINDDKYSTIYDLYINSMCKRNLNIDSIFIIMTDIDCYSKIRLTTNNNEIIYENPISVGAGIIIGLKSERPIFMRNSELKEIDINKLNPKDFMNEEEI